MAQAEGGPERMSAGAPCPDSEPPRRHDHDDSLAGAGPVARATSGCNAKNLIGFVIRPAARGGRHPQGIFAGISEIEYNKKGHRRRDEPVVRE